MDKVEELEKKIKSEQGWLKCLECSDNYDRWAIEKQKDYIYELEDLLENYKKESE